jgi:hypothetical protein
MEVKMKNIVGQTPRGKNFYPRTKLMNLLYRRLASGSNIYMAAPRRVGKTAIMRYLEDNPKDEYNAVYIITESIDNTEIFFKTLLDELFKSSAIGKLKKVSNKSSELIGNFIERFKKIGGFGFEVELKDTTSSFYEEFKTLVKKLDNTNGLKIVIMVDEFPQTVENILRKSEKREAIRFLQLNREVRQEATENVLFILTGSIGLPTLAEKLNATGTINDLNVFEVPPFDKEEAQELTTILLKSEGVPYEDEAISYMLDKLRWLSPYHIQLLVQEFADEYDLNDKSVTKESVDEAFERITDRRNDANFAHYYERLYKAFVDNELSFALELLKDLSRQDEIELEHIKTLAETHDFLENYPFVLRTLEFDGYIFRSQKNDKILYRFTSPILKLWWSKYVFR